MSDTWVSAGVHVAVACVQHRWVTRTDEVNQEFLFTTKHWHVDMVEDVLGLGKKCKTTFLSLSQKGEASEGETGKR